LGLQTSPTYPRLVYNSLLVMRPNDYRPVTPEMVALLTHWHTGAPCADTDGGRPSMAKDQALDTMLEPRDSAKTITCVD